MESSSRSKNTRDDESTARATAGKSVKTFDDKLRARRVARNPTPDAQMDFKSILKTELPVQLLETAKELERAAENFLQKMAEKPRENCYEHIEEFSYRVDYGRWRIGYPAITDRYFQADLERCGRSNEAMLQRTIMIHIINRHWLDKIFDWNTEGQWVQTEDTRLPSREEDEISMPKPDLAISFTLKSFTGDDDSEPMPQELKSCIRPDGGDRCFPFLFMEVKKAATDLQAALLANLHYASQALYNIYQWMAYAEQQDTFFSTVRVFSVAFNAKDLIVRVHRAVQLANGNLSFHFDEPFSLAGYNRNQACQLIKTILDDYAAKTLHPALKNAFRCVVQQEDERLSSKRKARGRSNSAKRVRRSANNIQGTGQSFAMGNLSTQDPM
jgi:hypothetical protein